MDNSIKKEDKPYMFALVIVVLIFISLELFKFGFALGKEMALSDLISKSVGIK